MRKSAWIAALAWFPIYCSANTAGAEVQKEDRLLIAQERLAFDLVRRLAREPVRNVVVTPASLAASLALIDLGTDTAMHLALHQTLGFQLQSGMAPDADLEGVRKTVVDLGKGLEDGATILTMPNLVVIDQNLTLHTAALNQLRASGTQVSIEDLKNAETLGRINKWVSKQTKGLIPSIIDGPLSKPGLVVLNAVYFKGLWSIPFVKEYTNQMPFQDAIGNKSQVGMMRTYRRMSFRRDGRFVAVDLPYRNERFSIVVVTTRGRPAGAAEFAEVGSWLGGTGFTEGDVDLSLPRFTVRDYRELLPALDDMGLRDGRKSPTAFHEMSPQPLELSAVTQRTYLRLDEQGTEAAAATETFERLIKRRPEDRIMMVDRPFLFALRDRSTGLILLSGYISRPDD